MGCTDFGGICGRGVNGLDSSSGIGFELLLKRGDEVAQFGWHIGLGVAAHSRQHARVTAAHELQQSSFEAAHRAHGQIVEIPLRASKDHDHLLFNRHRAVQWLLEQFHQAIATVELSFGDGVEFGAKRSEGFQLAELGEVELQGTRDALHRLDLRCATHSGHRHTHVDGWANARLEQVVLQIDLAIGDGNHVGWNVGSHVAGLGLDHRQCSQRSGSTLVAELGGAFQQTAVEVEHVAGVRFATRWTTQQQRHLAVGLGLLGKVVIHDESVLAILHPVLANRATTVWGEILERCRVAGRGRDNDRVLHRAVLAQGLDSLGDSGTLLTNSDIDALHAQAALVDDRVDGDSCLARFAVADDQLTLTTTNRRHRIDGLDTGLQRLVNGFTPHDARRLNLDTALDRTDEVALAINRHAERVDDTAEQCVANGNRQDAPRGLDRLTFFNRIGVAKDDRANRIFVEVEGQAHRTIGEFEQLVHAAVGKSRHAGDSVANFSHATNGARLERGLETVKILLERCRNVAGAQGELCHVVSVSYGSVWP